MARKLFEKQGIRRRNGQLASGVTFVVYSDVAGTALADISATSGGSAIAGSEVTTADIAGLGPAAFRFYGPPSGQDTLYLRCPADTSLGVQELEADEDERLDALEAGAAGIPGTIFDAKGDIIAASAADTAARLGVGANDTVLTADSSTATGLKWATGGGSSIPATLFDAKGDLLAASAADTAARLAVGANGTGLTADSAATTGVKWLAPPVFNVKAPPFNALGNNAADDTAAIQAAIDAAVTAGRGEVYIPAGIYLFKPQTARTDDPALNGNQGHGLAVTGDNITIRGAGREATRLVMRPFASISGNHETSYQTVLGKVWRGGAFFLTTGASAGAPRKNILIRDLAVDGGCLYTGDTTTPAAPGTGDGLDITHKCVWLSNGGFFNNIRVEDCELFGFKGEVIFYGGDGALIVAAERCLIHDTNGDCWSVSGQCIVRDNEFHTAAHAGVEDGLGRYPCWYERNDIHNCADHGISLFQDTGQPDLGAPVVVRDNLVRNCPRHGISLQWIRNVDLRGNKVVDCANTATYRGINVNTQAGKPIRNTKIVDNQVQAHLLDTHTGVGVFDSGGGGYQGLEIRDNLAELTESGRSLGKTLAVPFHLTAPVSSADVIRGNRALRSTANYTDRAACTGRLLGTTTATDVVEVTPWAHGQHLVSVYYRVVTAATNVTVTMAWTDDAGAQSKTLMALTSKAAGSYTDIVPVVVDSVAGSQIKVTVTAGTADQVYVTASIEEITSAGPVFSPANLAGLQLWLKADSLTGLADGTAVATWEDSSDQNRDATQGTAANRPLYKTAILNNRPVLRFDGSNDQFGTVSYSLAQPFLIVTVASSTGTTGPVNIHGGSTGGGAQILVHTGNYKLYSGALAVAQAATTAAKILSATFNGASSTVRVNGPASSVTVNAGTNGFSGGSTIGNSDVGGSERLAGDVAEMLVFKPVPSAGDLLKIEQYLGAKYGITVA